MSNRTELRITHAVEKFAVYHGAYFDKETLGWFVDGEVPGPLLSYIVKEQRRRDYVTDPVLSPRCVCGAQMTIRRNRSTGAQSWACSARRCTGHRHLDVDGFQQQTPARRDPPNDQKNLYESKESAAAVIAMAVALFRSESRAAAWLQAPKVGLQGATPLDAMKTTQGCAVVERILEERFA